MCIMDRMSRSAPQSIEIVVQLQMLTSAEGGRTGPVKAVGRYYRPQLSLEGGSASTSFLVEAVDGSEELRPGQSATVRGWLLVPQVLGNIEPGLGFTLREGPRVVARGNILSVGKVGFTP
jgi:translation elongation factor EF-Tu-like GTPase